MLLKRLFVSFLLSTIGISQLWAKSASLEGLWETIDDRTGQKKAIVKIYKKDSSYYADIVKVYWKKNDKKICIHCKDNNRRNKPIEGMNFVWDLKPHSALLWDDGSILDPHNGQVYKVRMKKIGNVLFVRAYLGLPVLGRTQEWHRYSH